MGAYVCHLTIAAPKLTMQPGGPAAYVSPAAGEHGRPQQGLVNPCVVPLLTLAPVAVPVIEAVAEAVALTALAPVALILALILGSSTPAGGPGITQPHFPPVSRDKLRLRELEVKHAAGTLTPGEEAELIALLAKVKGIHVQKLADLPKIILPNASSLSTQTITNKFPKEPLPSDGKIIPYSIIDGNIKGVNGKRQFDFIVDNNGGLVIGDKHHTLGNREAVQAAGQIRLNGKGQIRQIDNLSGHYQPSVAETSNYPAILDLL